MERFFKVDTRANDVYDHRILRFDLQVDATRVRMVGSHRQVAVPIELNVNWWFADCASEKTTCIIQPTNDVD